LFKFEHSNAQILLTRAQKGKLRVVSLKKPPVDIATFAYLSRVQEGLFKNGLLFAFKPTPNSCEKMKTYLGRVTVAVGSSAVVTGFVLNAKSSSA
jgi:hypothetical protein